MMRELEMVVLMHNQAHGLKAGDIGTVVHVYKEAAAYEVEFVTAEGRTVAVLTLSAADVRPMTNTEILHVRELAWASM